MVPKSVSERANSLIARRTRAELDEQRKLLGGSRREVLGKLGIKARGRQFTEEAGLAIRNIATITRGVLGR